MDVGVGGAREHRAHDLVERAGRELLRRGEASTLAAVMVPTTVPDCGHVGGGGTLAGAGLVALWHNQMMIGPFTAASAKWMCDCVTVPCKPENVSV